jgi:hypothetical protein
VEKSAIVNRWRRRSRAESGVGRWYDPRTLRIRIDRDFDDVLRSFSHALECELLIEHGAAEVDDGSVRQATEFVDEITYRDDRGMGDGLVMTLTHDLLLHSADNRDGIVYVPIRSAD